MLDPDHLNLGAHSKPQPLPIRSTLKGYDDVMARVTYIGGEIFQMVEKGFCTRPEHLRTRIVSPVSLEDSSSTSGSSSPLPSDDLSISSGESTWQALDERSVRTSPSDAAESATEGPPHQTAHRWMSGLQDAVKAVQEQEIQGTQISYPDGSWYIGEVEGTQPHGLGRMVLVDGTIRIGNFQPPKSLLSGPGLEQRPDGTIVVGHFLDGSPHGVKCQINPHGSIEVIFQMRNGVGAGWTFNPGEEIVLVSISKIKEETSILTMNPDGSSFLSKTTERGHQAQEWHAPHHPSYWKCCAVLNAAPERGMDIGAYSALSIPWIQQDLHALDLDLVSSAAKSLERPDGPSSIQEMAERVNLSELRDLQDEVLSNTWDISKLSDPIVQQLVFERSQHLPVMIHGGYREHAIGYVLYQGTLFVCNRAGSSLDSGQGREKERVRPEAHMTLDTSRMPELWALLTKVHDLPPSDAESLIYGQGADSLAHLSKAGRWDHDPLTARQVVQTRGNCAFFSPLTGFYVSTVLILQKILRTNYPTATAGEVEQAAKLLGRLFYKELRKHQKQDARVALQSMGIPWLGNFYYGSYETSPNGQEKRPSGHGVLLSAPFDEGGKILYQGEFREGLRHGVGTLYEHGQPTYQGEFCHDLPEGRGAWTYPLGDPHKRTTYRGHFHNGIPEGPGELRYSNGSTFSGVFVGGAPDGPGVLQTKDGTRISGHFKGSSIEGSEGEIRTPTTIYKGMIVKNKPSGFGHLKHLTEKWSYSGTFENGKMHGRGHFISQTGLKSEAFHDHGVFLEDPPGPGCIVL
ncbi:MAG: hypothetical protein ACOYKZ_04495 [Chlamydiia bacterium]